MTNIKTPSETVQAPIPPHKLIDLSQPKEGPSRTTHHIKQEDRATFHYLSTVWGMSYETLVSKAIDLIYMLEVLLPERKELAVMVNMPLEDAKKLGRLWTGLPFGGQLPLRQRAEVMGDILALHQFAAETGRHVVVFSDDPLYHLSMYGLLFSMVGVDTKTRTISHRGRTVMTFVHPFEDYQRLMGEEYEQPNVKAYRMRNCETKLSKWMQTLIDRDYNEMERAIEQHRLEVTKDIGDFAHPADPEYYRGVIIMKQADVRKLEKYFVSARPSIRDKLFRPFNMDLSEEEADAVLKMREKKSA